MMSHRGICLAAVIFTTVGVLLAPSAAADDNASLREAVAALHQASCGQLHNDPVVEQSAAKIGEATDRYINHDARFLPEDNPLPLLKDLGYGGSKATILSGAGSADTVAIKGLLLQGYQKIPDCQYTDFGVDTRLNKTKKLVLTTVVLAG